MRLIFILVCLVFTLTACQSQEQSRPGAGKVSASPAYLQHFGEPPTPEQGYVYAQVGYLPLSDLSGQVRPLPLFLFSENQHLDRILSQLFSDKLVVSPRSQLSQPFAQGVRLEQLDQAGDTLTVSLSVSAAGQKLDQQGIDRAITETAVQFEEVGRVRVLYNGEPSKYQPLEGYQGRADAIAAVGPPLLLDVVGVWDDGDDELKEILVNFDRPIEINSFRLLDRSGEQIGGQYFTSIFNMAVVVHPAQPENFKQGTVLNVVWDISDSLGRRNSALDQLPLNRSEH